MNCVESSLQLLPLPLPLLLLLLRRRWWRRRRRKAPFGQTTAISGGQSEQLLLLLLLLSLSFSHLIPLIRWPQQQWTLTMVPSLLLLLLLLADEEEEEDATCSPSCCLWVDRCSSPVFDFDDADDDWGD